MAYGDTEHDEALRTAWHDFCDRLKDVGELVFADPSPATPLERAVGLQYVARNISAGLDIGLEHADRLYPHLFRMMGPYRKWGGDNPDCVYFWAFIDGRETYRLVGNRGSAHFVAFSANRPAEAVPEGESAEVGRLLGGELETEWDGSFVVTLSPEPQPGNWIRTRGTSACAGCRRTPSPPPPRGWSSSPICPRSSPATRAASTRRGGGSSCGAGASAWTAASGSELKPAAISPPRRPGSPSDAGGRACLR